MSYQKSFDLADIMGSDYAFRSKGSNTLFDKEEHLKRMKEEVTSSSSLPPEYPPLVMNNKPDGAWELSYLVASKWFKKPMCEFVFGIKDLSYDLLDFLKNNATCIFRTTHQTSPDGCYIFFYKNVFLHLSVGAKEDEEKMTITGLTIYYTVDNPIPYDDINQFKSEDKTEKPKIGIVKASRGGMYISKLNLSHTQTFSFEHYNDDFEEFEAKMVQQLSEKKPGLFLFHGEPGTGKSSAIRHLVETVKRNFIFIPPQMISHLSSPEFADIITDTHKGSVLIIEDAEKALMKRESEDGFSNSTLVSSVLNLTDGLYADLGQLAIIATYNCDRNLIDPALLRKGRLKAEYRFDKLTKHKAQTLAEKIGKNIEVIEDMTLADIFNFEDQISNNEKVEKKSIGFGFGG